MCTAFEKSYLEPMKKERLTGFFDAMLAIIMTILVLEMDPPQAPTLAALWELRVQFFSYAVSFFWLGTMWVHLVITWNSAEYIDPACLGWSLCLLFFSSLIPFATSFVNDYSGYTLPEILYVSLTLIITLLNLELNKAIRQANAANTQFVQTSLKRCAKLRVDLAIKATGLVMALLWPEYALLPVLISLIYIIV